MPHITHVPEHRYVLSMQHKGLIKTCRWSLSYHAFDIRNENIAVNFVSPQNSCRPKHLQCHRLASLFAKPLTQLSLDLQLYISGSILIHFSSTVMTHHSFFNSFSSPLTGSNQYQVTWPGFSCSGEQQVVLAGFWTHAQISVSESQATARRCSTSDIDMYFAETA